MKNGKSLEETIGYIGAIDRGVSLPKFGNNAFGRSATYYKTGFLNQLTSGQALLSSDKADVGVSTFDGNKLPRGVKALVTGIRVLFDTTASVQTNGIKSAAFKSEAPVAFKNGEFKMTQGGQLVLLSGSDVTNFKGTSNGNDDDFRDVVPFMLRSQAAIEILLNLAGAAAVDQAYKIELRVIEIAEDDVV